MELAYRLAGISAEINARLSRIRINLLPLNLIVMIGLAAGIVFAIAQIGEARVNSRKPKPVSVSQVLARPDMVHNYISVTGMLVPSVLVKYSTLGKATGTPSRVYGLMVDQAGKRALFVESSVKEDASDEQPKDRAVITGMLRSLDNSLRAKIDEMEGQFEGIPIETDLMLVEGARPAKIGAAVAVVVSCGVLFLFLAATYVSKYVVFREMPEHTTSHPVPDSIDIRARMDLRVTGEFKLNEKSSHRFLNVPARAEEGESGKIVFSSAIDASSRFMGITTKKLAGTWEIMVPRENITSGRTGRLYLGLLSRPALEVKSVDGNSTIISFATEVERESLISEMSRAGHQPVYGGV